LLIEDADRHVEVPHQHVIRAAGATIGRSIDRIRTRTSHARARRLLHGDLRLSDDGRVEQESYRHPLRT